MADDAMALQLEIETDLLAAELDIECEDEAEATDGPDASPAGKSGSKRSTDGSVKNSGHGGKAAQTVAGVRKANKTHTRKCKCCNLYFKPESMGAKSPYCLRDKNKIDNVARLAKQQNKSEWFKEIRADPRKLQMVVKVYTDLTGAEGLEKKKAGFGLCE